MTIYNKLKRQNGEKFTQAIKKHAPAVLVHERALDVLLHAGRDPNDVPKLSEALHAIILPDAEKVANSECPLKLLSDAGYDAYIVTDQKSQDSIKKYFAPNERLCTFGTDRYKSYNIINAVKKNVDSIKRSSNPKRQDEYGTSVLSIQVRNGFISIKNRYNHKVSNCDATFNNNLDNIITGLRAAVEHKFKISLAKGSTPDGFMIVDDKIVKVVQEIDGIYYGDCCIIKNGAIVEMAEDEYLYAYFIYNQKNKTMRLFDEKIKDSFPDDFNKYYGGKRSLRVDRRGNLCDGDMMLLGVER